MASGHPIPAHGRFQDLTGRTFGRLSVVSYRGPAPGHQLWECLCSCGGSVVVRSNNLLTGHSTSCGCYQDEFRREGRPRARHRGSHSPEWAVWQSLISRCHNTRNHSYRNYGGRGITVCDRWRECFDNFIADMGKRPGPGYCIERTNNDLGYTPENCRWATRLDQGNNKRNNRLLAHGGETHTLAEWSRLTGIGPDTIAARLEKLGWPVEKALSTPVRGKAN